MKWMENAWGLVLWKLVGMCMLQPPAGQPQLDRWNATEVLIQLRRRYVEQYFAAGNHLILDTVMSANLVKGFGRRSIVSRPKTHPPRTPWSYVFPTFLVPVLVEKDLHPSPLKRLKSRMDGIDFEQQLMLLYKGL
jgi:hypothetical protein